MTVKHKAHKQEVMYTYMKMRAKNIYTYNT